MLLLVAAGLFGRTFQQLTHAPLGFDRLLVATVRKPTTPPADQSEVRHRLARAVASLPGVAAAGGADQAPLYTTYPAFPLSLPGVAPLPAPEALTHMVPFLTGTGIVDFALARDRLVARLAAFAGLLALSLTALGVGGVTAYHATRRRPELAVRAALGSTRGRLVGLVFAGAALTIAVVGLLAGWVPAHRASRLHLALALTETRS